MELLNHEMQLNLAEKLTFLKKFIESPSQVGSITPSSRFLAKRTLAPINWTTARAVAELGAGTGAFTKHINAFKHDECKVAVFEKDEEMRDKLNILYPDLDYFEDALSLSENVRSMGVESLDAVISGLPFTLFEKNVREQIIDETVQALNEHGVFVAFQYSLHMKTMLSQKFSKVEISLVHLNFPPAFVYVCHK